MSSVSNREALIGRLPRTMAASMNEQLARRHMLFPVEQRLLDSRLEWLEHLGRAEFDRLFAAVMAIETKLALPPLAGNEGRLSIERTAIIARSPLYPDWRRETERVFAAIDAGVDAMYPTAHVPRLVLCVLPRGLPANPDPWRDVTPNAVRIAFAQEFAEFQSELLASIARRRHPAALTPIETTWVVSCEARPYTDLTGVTVVSWDDTAAVRREFLDRLNGVARTLHSVDETMAALERIDLGTLLPARLTGDTRLREFIRSLLLTGNGSLVVNNSFVQWCASEALRRAQPQVLVAAFGVRDKPKPFSSLVWFEDQARSNPVPDQRDPQGSLVDDAMLSRYVYLTTQRLAPYAGRTLALFAIADRKSALLVAPDPKPDWLSRIGQPVSIREIRDACLNWLR